MNNPENDEERRSRNLKELEGKNISHYSVMLSAYITSRIDANKGIFTFSSAAIGLLAASFDEPLSGSCVSSILYTLSMLAFVIAVISTLFIYVSNTKSIEAYIRNEKEDEKSFHLKKWVYINYVTFGVGILLTAVLAIVRAYA